MIMKSIILCMKTGFLSICDTMYRGVVCMITHCTNTHTWCYMRAQYYVRIPKPGPWSVHGMRAWRAYVLRVLTWAIT